MKGLFSDYQSGFAENKSIPRTVFRAALPLKINVYFRTRSIYFTELLKNSAAIPNIPISQETTEWRKATLDNLLYARNPGKPFSMHFPYSSQFLMQYILLPHL